MQRKKGQKTIHLQFDDFFSLPLTLNCTFAYVAMLEEVGTCGVAMELEFRRSEFRSSELRSSPCTDTDRV